MRKVANFNIINCIAPKKILVFNEDHIRIYKGPGTSHNRWSWTVVVETSERARTSMLKPIEAYLFQYHGYVRQIGKHLDRRRARITGYAAITRTRHPGCMTLYSKKQRSLLLE